LVTNHSSSPHILQHVYYICYNFSASLIGKKKTREMFDNSYQKIIPYFQLLSQFKISDKNELIIEQDNISDKELLAFTVWIQQFIKELKQFMVGLGKLNIETLTEEIKEQLEEIGFYEYYKQATELEY